MSIVMPVTSAAGGLHLQHYRPEIEKSGENT
jgi:hypothetical protein